MPSDLPPVHIAIFASGAGSNAREIIRYFHENRELAKGRPVQISLVVCNKPGAGVLEIAKSAGIQTLLIEKENFFRGSHYIEELRQLNISFIVLAGFLWKIPVELIRAFPEHIINIHPALLPFFGGKGMYGEAVHNAVIEQKARESGITIHYVDEQYDHGRMFFQISFAIQPGETVESLTSKIHALEHEHYPAQIRRWIESKLSLNS
jgi:phosphoribosylglycinamide formyltransferase 1